MSLFVSLSDFKRKPKVPVRRPEGVGKFTGKKSETPQVGDVAFEDKRSQVELATVRIAKFIPSLVILCYASLCNLVNSKNIETEASLRLLLFEIALGVCIVLTPIYIYYFDRKNPLCRLNVFIGTLAFPIWAYAFPCGVFVDIKASDPVIAGFLLIVFSLVTAVIPAPQLGGDRS
jgi:hypothetical protein